MLAGKSRRLLWGDSQLAVSSSSEVCGYQLISYFGSTDGVSGVPVRRPSTSMVEARWNQWWMSRPSGPTYVAPVQVNGLQPIPVLVPVDGDPGTGSSTPVLERFVPGLSVGYLLGPPYRGRLVTWRELDRLGWSQRGIHDAAVDVLDERVSAANIHGKPPTLMMSFDGLESSLLLVDMLWDRLSRSIPGDLVVGVPARDVLIVTSSRSRSGLERVRRAVDRTFYASPRYPLTARLLIRRNGVWGLVATPRSAHAMYG